MRKRQCIEARPVSRVVIFGAPTNWRETAVKIHFNGRVAIANFEVDARYARLARTMHEVVEQETANHLAMMPRKHSEQKQLGFIGNGP